MGNHFIIRVNERLKIMPSKSRKNRASVSHIEIREACSSKKVARLMLIKIIKQV